MGNDQPTVGVALRREAIMAIIDANKCEPWTVDRAGQMADEILALRTPASGPVEADNKLAVAVEALELSLEAAAHTPDKTAFVEAVRGVLRLLTAKNNGEGVK